MRSRRRGVKVRSWVGAVSLLAASLGLAVVRPTPATAAAIGGISTVGTITQLSFGSASDQQEDPAISGTRVVWTDNRQTSDIILYDLITNGPAQNLTNTPQENEFLEDINGSHVVWTHQSSTQPGDIVLYDIESGVPNTIASSGVGLSFVSPALSQRYAVFARTTTQVDIDGYDVLLGGALPAQVTNDVADQARPRESGDVIVYEDYNEPHGDIFGYHVSTSGPRFAIATGAAAQTQADIDGNRVVWVSSTGPGTDQVMLQDLSSGATTQLSTVASSKRQPRVSGNWVVWADDRNGPLDLYGYNLGTGKEVSLVTGDGYQFLADIDGNRIVYTDNSAGFEQIFLLTLDTTPPVLHLPADITTQATGPGGARVTYSATATDDIDPAPGVSCTPPSSATFPRGTTTVSCTATDAAGNSSTERFRVTVTGLSSKLTANPAIAQVGPGTKVYFPNLTATLKDGAKGSPLSGRTITFTVSGSAICAAATNSSGVATCAGGSTNPKVVQARSYTASFAGDAGYDSSTASAGLIRVTSS